MKNNDVIRIYENSSILKTLKGFELSKAIVLNLRLIKSELIDVLDETYGQTEDFKKFLTERNNLIKEYSKKDASGEVIMKGKETIIENKEEFEGKFNILKESFKDTLEEMTKKQQDLFEALEVECSIKFNMIEEDWLKTTDISVEQMDLIETWIKK